MASDKVNYPEVGGIAQAIKYQIRTGGFWDGLTGSSKELLDQIATAIARMVAGDGTHWDAIIGYAHAAKPGTEKAEPEPSHNDGGHHYGQGPAAPPAREKGQDELSDAVQRLARDRVQRNQGELR